MNGMTEQLMGENWRQLAMHLLSVRKSGSWKGHAGSFESYCARRWSISKTRAKLMCDFATFCEMARRHMLRLPDSPDNLKPILALPQKHWMNVWQVCMEYNDHGHVSAQSAQALLDHLGINARKRIPESVLKAQRVRKAARTMASFEDGAKLADEIGVDGFGREWGKAVAVTIEADDFVRSEKGR